MLKKLLMIAGVVGALVGTTVVAVASTNGSNGSGSTSPNAVAGTGGGMPPTAQVQWAVVNADASLARAFPKTATSTRVGTGAYQVAFPKKVDGCAYEATIGNAGAGNPAHGTIVVAARAGNVNAVFVETRDVAGNLADRGFHLGVMC